MNRLRSFERILFRLSFVLFLALTARFGWVVAQHTFNKPSAPTPAATSIEKSPLAQLAELQRQVGQQIAAPTSIDSAIAQALGSASTASSAATAQPQYVKSYLSVQVGAARSELRVGGVVVGRTPYVGQITCQRGKTVKIDLLPPKGMPKSYELPCLDGEMRLLDEP